MADGARIYQCPNCGGPTSEAERRCQHCTAPVATERCIHCFHMNVSGTRHCSGCGRELGLGPVPNPSTTQCPSCRTALSELHEPSGTLWDCQRCAGQFVQHALLRDLLERRDQLGRAVPRAQKPQNPLAHKVVYRPCPLCAALMHRRNFGAASGVIVDICTLHGVWFDAGELPGVLAFVEGGGLEKARAREANRSQEPRIGLVVVNPSSDDLDLGISDLARGVGELLDFIRKLISARR